MLVGKLEKAANLKAFEYLVLIADPKTLGRVRQYMSKALSGMVTNELNLDVVGMPLDCTAEKGTFFIELARVIQPLMHASGFA